MSQEWFKLLDVYILWASIGAVVLFYGLFSSILKHYMNMPEVAVALFVGILIGTFPGGYTFLDPHDWFQVEPEIMIMELARFVIGVQLMSTALGLPRGYFRNHWKPLITLLLPVMTVTWVFSGLITWALLPQIGFWPSMVIGACVTPTDPVISATIITGRFANEHVNVKLRHLLSTESGANDGLGYPFVILSLLFVIKASTGEALFDFFVISILYEVALATLFGVAVGYCAAKLLRFAEARQLVDKASWFAFTVALSITMLGVVRIFDADELLAVFACGVILRECITSAQRHHESHVQEAVDLLVTIAFFVVFGVTIPWHGWVELGWQGAVLALILIFFRRVPFVMLSYPLLKPSVRSWREAMFLGWFCPIGVAALFYATFAWDEIHESPHAHDHFAKVIWWFATEVVVFSVVIYGVTAMPFTRLISKTDPIAFHSGGSSVLFDDKLPVR